MVTREVIVYSAKGVYEICRWSQQSKADKFYDWVYNILENLRTGQATILPNLSKLSPEMQMFGHMFKAVANMELKQKQIENQITAIKDTITAREDDWRAEVVNKLRKIGFRTASNYKEVTRESYKILKERARCNLDTRLENLKERMAAQGATKTAINKANYLDVIEADKWLTEIYINIVNQLYIKHVA